MKILQLCKKFPYPLKDGESIAVNTLSRSLVEMNAEVTLLAMNTTKHYYAAPEYPSELNHYKEIFTVKVDNQIRLTDAFLNLFSKESYHISRFISPAFQRELLRLLRSRDYEVIQLETLYLAPYIPVIRQHSDAIIVMRTHNVEYEIWERIAGNTRTRWKRWYLKHLTAKLKRYEREQLNQCDLLAPISPRDEKQFQALGPCATSTVIPIGLDASFYQPDYDSFHRPLSVSFIGSLDWMPNQEGLKWFLDKVWGRVSKEFPELQLHVAGRNTPDWLLRRKQKNLVVHGEVSDARAFINQHSLMVVPLLSGSGMRAKILEGMALGKVVLSTRLGLEGIPAVHGENVFIADTPQSFLEAFRKCTAEHKQLEYFGRKARGFVVDNYNSHTIAKKLLQFYTSLTVEAL